MYKINWDRIGRAVKFYESRGYTYVEVPWAVNREDMLATVVDPYRIFSSEGLGDLVGSAEQSFLYRQRLGSLGTGSFVACTPCFRREPVVDDRHQEYFVKVELHVNENVGVDTYRKVVVDCLDFMQLETPRMCELVQTGENEADIEIVCVEVGSYGIRKHNGYSWIYGTGLAEPRFSSVC